MTKSKQIKISDLVFNKQKDAEDYVRDLLLQLEKDGFVDKSSIHWPFFCELLAHHHQYDEKRGAGISKFHIGRSKYNHIEMSLERVDGALDNVSWKKCVTGKATSVIGNLKAAMRVEIESQIESLKATFNPDKICEICSTTLTERKDTHADHIEHFDILVENFLQTNQDYPIIFDDEPITNRAMFKSSDSHFAKRWYEYHQKTARLRLVHSTCNLKRKKASQ